MSRRLSGINPRLEQAINSVLAIGRVDAAPYVAIAILRRCVAANPGVSPAEILAANGIDPSPDGDTWSTAIWSLADLWTLEHRALREAKQRAPPMDRAA